MPYRQPTKTTHTTAYFEYPDSFPHTMRPVEEEIWSALRLLGAQGAALRLLRRRFPTRREARLTPVAGQIASCVRQAEEYFWLAVKAPSRIAPLLHYYSMLNLTKALIYLAWPERLQHSSQFRHGLTDPHKIKDPQRYSLRAETIRATSQGIFPSLFAVLTGAELPSPTDYPLGDLLRYCTWITQELDQGLGLEYRLVNAQFRTSLNLDRRLAWVTVDIPRLEVLAHCGTIAHFRADAPVFCQTFRRVASSPEILRFESAPVSCTSLRSAESVTASLRKRVRDVRLYRHFLVPKSERVGEYLVPLQVRGAEPLPEPCVLYAITFYLGSLVRYQPHVYESMLGGEEAWLVEAFTRQCPTCFAHIMLNHLWQQERIFQPR